MPPPPNDIDIEEEEYPSSQEHLQHEQHEQDRQEGQEEKEERESKSKDQVGSPIPQIITSLESVNVDAIIQKSKGENKKKTDTQQLSSQPSTSSENDYAMIQKSIGDSLPLASSISQCVDVEANVEKIGIEGEIRIQNDMPSLKEASTSECADLEIDQVSGENGEKDIQNGSKSVSQFLSQTDSGNVTMKTKLGLEQGLEHDDSDDEDEGNLLISISPKPDDNEIENADVDNNSGTVVQPLPKEGRPNYSHESVNEENEDLESNQVSDQTVSSFSAYQSSTEQHDHIFAPKPKAAPLLQSEVDADIGLKIDKVQGKNEIVSSSESIDLSVPFNAMEVKEGSCSSSVAERPETGTGTEWDTASTGTEQKVLSPKNKLMLSEEKIDNGQPSLGGEKDCVSEQTDPTKSETSKSKGLKRSADDLELISDDSQEERKPAKRLKETEDK